MYTLHQYLTLPMDGDPVASIDELMCR